MKNKQYKKFLELFRFLNEAALIICKTLNEKLEHSIYITDSIQQLIIETNEFIDIPYYKIQKEIESNLYEFSEGKIESYIVRLLKDWIFIIPYFDISNTRESYRINLQMINSKSKQYLATKNLIERNFGNTEPRLFYGEATSVEKYILLCHTAYQHFFQLLNELCVDFNVDLVVLQEKAGIVAWDRFDPNFKMWKNSNSAPPEKIKQNESEKTGDVKNHDIEAVFKKLKEHIKFDKDEKTRKLVKGYLNQLSDNSYFNDSDDKDFATIATIFYQSGWLTNINTFEKWKSLFSEAFNRKKSTYKLNRLKKNTELIKRKIPFLNEIPDNEKK